MPVELLRTIVDHSLPETITGQRDVAKVRELAHAGHIYALLPNPGDASGEAVVMAVSEKGMAVLHAVPILPQE